jgi:hypothetical protein
MPAKPVDLTPEELEWNAFVAWAAERPRGRRATDKRLKSLQASGNRYAREMQHLAWNPGSPPRPSSWETLPTGGGSLVTGITTHGEYFGLQRGK